MSFVVISPNNFNFNDDIDNFIKNHVKIEEVAIDKDYDDNAKYCIVKSLRISPKDSGNTDTILEYQDRIFQMSYIEEFDKKTDSKELIENKFASLVTFDNNKIYGYVTLCMVSVSETNKFTPMKMTMDDLKFLVCYKVKFTVLCVEPDNKITETILSKNDDKTQIEKLLGKEKWQYTETNYLKYNLLVYYT